MEVEKRIRDNGDSHEVVVSMPGTEENSLSSKISEASSRESADYMKLKPPDVDVKRQEPLSSSIQMISNPSPGISNLSPSPNRPPKPPSESSFRRRTVSNSANSKSKSRLVEPQAIPKKPVVDSAHVSPSNPPYRNSPKILSPSSIVATPKESGRKSSGNVTPRTPLMASNEDDEDDYGDGIDVYTSGTLHGNEKKKGKKMRVMVLIEWFLFVAILALLISSFTINKINDAKIWKVQIWRLSVLALVIFCGRLVTEWFTNLLTFLIERNFILKRNVMYFLYGLRQSVRVFIWLGLILLTWVLLINRGVERSIDTKRALNKITRGIACSLGGAALWMVKTFLIKLLASSFHVKTFFDRIQESIFHQYVLQTLSGPPLMVYEIGNARTSGQLSFNSTTTTKKGKQKEVVDELVDVDKLYKMNREKVTAWTMSGLIDVIRNRRLSTLVGTIDEIDDEGVQQVEISNELEAKACANRIFKNVAKPGKKYIEEDDLLRFMTREEVDNAFPLFQGAIETGQIKKSAFKIWVTYAYNERKCLAHSLNDSKTAIEELNRISSVAVLVIIGIMWLLLMDITSTKVLVYISSQLLVLVFMFGNTFKTLFEGIIFNFIVHPFDVGDRCVIDGVEMVVEEMNLLTTIFLRHDNEKIYYPNSILSTLPISNFNRSPEMADSVDFAVDFSTSVESIAALKEKMKAKPAMKINVLKIDNNSRATALSLEHHETSPTILGE
ncbi:hypothetical protein Leryth_010274 [Lithospermum erythrorhizon]|nr:hypothetical protein Leryth_010274 [Lithospermum erythrorhizon]